MESDHLSTSGNVLIIEIDASNLLHSHGKLEKFKPDMPSKVRSNNDGDSDGSARREQQRRLRNRLSQKAVRERRAARVQQLESQLASITKSDDSGRVKKLVDANSKLRHTLLNTRKKLASLSATAAQLGDQLKLVLEDHEDQDGEEVEKKSEVRPDQIHHDMKDPARIQKQSPPSDSHQLDTSPGHLDSELFDNDELELHGRSTNVEDDAIYSMDTIRLLDDQWSFYKPTLYSSSNSQNAFDFSPALHAGPSLRVYNGSVFSEHLDQIHGLLRLIGGADGRTRIWRAVELMVAAFLEQGWPSLRRWMDVTQSNLLAARVLWWQTSNSQEAATQVPPGNAPTAVQRSGTSYPSILDWVPHPGMRDVLILDYESYNVDQVIVDMTNFFVVEVEDSMPPVVGTGLDLPLPSLCSGRSYNLMDLVERTLMFGPLDSRTQQQVTLPHLLRSMVSNAYAQHPIHSFKLDPRFFHKYPGLYDANAESKYQSAHPSSAQRSELPLPFTVESVKKYMNVALQAKVH